MIENGQRHPQHLPRLAGAGLSDPVIAEQPEPERTVLTLTLTKSGDKKAAIKSDDKVENGDTEIVKQECYVFDFALDRALRQISDYSCRLDAKEANPEKKVAEFINFLPVLAYDGSSMKQVSAQDVLDIAMSGTSATLLAKRWQSALLVNVDNSTLKRLMDNQQAMDALSRIEAFRSLNQDIQTIINKSEAVKNKKEKGDKLSHQEKKELSEAEKEFKSKRKEIQEKLMKFATRIPVFMYLTDYRERSLKDIITQLEPELFKRVTGLNEKDFDLLCSIGVFNANLMNDAIFKFKRYEDSSLSYTGIDKNADKDVGGWDTVLKRAEYEKLFYNQQDTMAKVPVAAVPAPTVEEPKKQEKPMPTQDEATKPISATPIVPSSKPLTTGATKQGSGSITSAKKPIASPIAAFAKKESYIAPKVKEGDVVKHKKFGRGTIESLDKAQIHLRVRFEDGEKTFIYPDAFRDGFLVIHNGGAD